ncbi:N-acetylated-alpha-linked acidic dipeptidase-like protein 2 [Melanomma pulvis-pyrius CBS 109.77]|uniref:N-acetylated-alpha-linked acidic dipeptidase-like protein 2 n=1 Tax=Melanomma pulvis-pyrius CBS 109.77 TaxID=1314802 RepID=A0A6A6XCF7_9PLEO|nr:N-acetylated-alpha-linked acidic dipeptidase-like protein 2 [Melanomma pulvis-pyrius CBS 109.77]
MKLILILTVGFAVQACPQEHHFRRHDRHIQQRLRDSNVFPPALDRNEKILIDSINASSLSIWSEYYTHRRNVAGEDDTVPKWTAKQWEDHGFSSRLDGYYVFLNYPVHRSLQLNHVNGSTYQPTLEEGVLDIDKTTTDHDRVPAYHGYSFSGNASAEYVYVGRGQRVDFDRLKSLGVTLEGKIALAKYGGPYRGIKVKNAQDYGMVGAVIFTDPGDDRNMTEAKGFAAYPDGPARNPTSIQRGSVTLITTYPGDPTTPGFPSKEDSPRMEKKTVPIIPSLPISWIEVQPLLQALNGHGISAEMVNRSNWVGAIPDVSYSTGPTPGATLSMSNIMESRNAWIWNTIGIINGTNEDEVVIVGNHHDAWMIGGAADPHSGSTILIELAKAFGKLLKTGWKPKRTIILASWDAEEYGLVGSTEWVEEYVPWLKDSVVSYLNIDVGVSGSIPDFSATPDLHSLTTSIAKKVIWPDGKDRTLYDIWEEKSGDIDPLGAQSDYTAFLHRGGIAAIDLGTTRAPYDPIYHTHSNYDSYYWMSTYADPGFVIHKAIGQYLTLMLYHLVDDDSIPLEPANYGPEMRAYLEELEQIISSSNATANLDLSTLKDAISSFEESAQQFNTLRASAILTNPDLLTELNHKARDFSRGFISQGGLPDRPFYQHLIFAPGVDTGYAPVTFPGITEAVTAGNLTLASEFIEKTTKAIIVAAAILKA